MRHDVLAAYPMVDPTRVHVVHNGIDADEYTPDLRTDVLHKWAIRPDTPTVCFVGRMTRQKGLPFLLRAAARLLTQLPPGRGEPAGQAEQGTIHAGSSPVG